ncbi:hypothetical protein ACF0H5_012915 [Mactra antiquata]
MRLIFLFVLISSCFGFEDVSVVQYLRENGFNNLTTAIDRIGITYLLETTGPYTIFAPTNEAFMRAGIYSFDIFTSEQLKALTQYTIVQEFVLVPNVDSLIVKNTMLNQTITVEPYQQTLLVNNISQVHTTGNNIIVNNGVIQPTDTVLTPHFWPTESRPIYNMHQLILLNDDKYSDLALTIVLADMQNVFQTGEYTLFAPTDDAFFKHLGSLPDPASPDSKSFYQELLKNHLVPGERLASQLENGDILYTLRNTQLVVTKTTGVIQIDTVNVIDTDLLATNGVIHSVDDLLIPNLP